MTDANQELPAEIQQAIAQIAGMSIPPKQAIEPEEQGVNGPIPAEDYSTTSLQDILAQSGAGAEIAFPDVKNDYELDNALIGHTAKSNGCVLQVPWVDSTLHVPVTIGIANYPVPVPVKIKPVAAYLSYVGKTSVPTGVHESYEFTKKKGFSRQFTASLEVKAKASVGIFGCEASLEVTTAFTYQQTITEETTETWTRSVTGPVDLWTFQPILVYVYKVPLSKHPDFSSLNDKLKRMFGPLYYAKSSDVGYAFVPVFRNTPAVVDHEIGYLALNDVVQYLCNEGWSRW